MNTRILLITVLITIFFRSSVAAEVYSYAKGNKVIGLTQTYIVKDDESLIEIARKFDLGYNEITDANPGLDPFIPGDGMSVKIPTSWILPDVKSYDSIVINLSEMRLYYFFTKRRSRMVNTFPIGIGSEGNNTPLGDFKVAEKIVRPYWRVPESIRKEKPLLPRIVPPGSGNPLGSHALRLSSKSILIHGTNRPYGIGRRVSHGCIRLYPEDIPKLFRSVPNGTRVTIVREPIKVGIKQNKVYIEVHKDEYITMNYFNEAVKIIRKKNLLKRIDTGKLYYAIRDKSGIPVLISD
jgi:L,D-transpeptidase ErfK/SrfK